MHKQIVLGVWATAALALGTAANAANEQSFYGGVGVGQANFEFSALGFDADDTGFKLFGGYKERYFGAEIAYFDGGSANQTLPSALLVPINYEFEVTGLNLSVLGRLPLTKQLALFGKFGVATYNIDGTARIGNGPSTEIIDTNDDGVTYGIGASYSFGPYDIRAEYEAVDMEDFDFNMLSISGAIKFKW